MEIFTRKRIGLLASVLLGLGGVSTLIEDLGSLYNTITDALSGNALGIVLIGSGVVLALYVLREEIMRALGIRTDSQLAKTITGWLVQNDSFSVERQVIKKELFHINSELHGRSFNVSKNRNDSYVSVMAGIKVEEKGRKLFADAPSRIRRMVHEDLIIELTQMGVQLKVENDDYVPTKIETKVVIQRPHEIGEISFMEQVLKVVLAQTCAHEILIRGERLAKEYLSSLPTPSPETSGGEHGQSPEAHPGK